MILLVLVSLNFASAAYEISCDLGVILLNQDPYPAIPGDEVKLVFQVNGTDNPSCGKVTLNFVESYPFTLVNGQQSQYIVESGTYTKDFSDFLIAPFKVKVDPEALEGDQLVKLSISNEASGTSTLSSRIYEFKVKVDDVRTDFEVSIKDYDAATQTLTFEILNVGENDVEALTVEIPKQGNINVKSSNRNIVGSLDSNDDTTFSFEATPKAGEIRLTIFYNDQTGERRALEKVVQFDPQYFEGRAGDKNGNSSYIWIAIIAVLVIGFFWWRARKKKQMHKHHLHNK